MADLRIFNPDGSEAELSGNGAREAILYLRSRGWTEQDELLDQDRRRGDPSTITGPGHCRVDMGHASLTSKDFPGGPADGRGELEVRALGLSSAPWRFQHVSIGNPQCAIRVKNEAALMALDLRSGPADRSSSRFPESHERVVAQRIEGHRPERRNRLPRRPNR